MKTVRNFLIVIVLLGGLLSVNAQKVIKVYPKHGLVVTKIHKPTVVLHKGSSFHYADGVWYKTRGKKYVVCAAPKGVAIKRLPKGYRVVRYKGRKLYKYKGVWYKKNKKAFVVVTV